MPLIYNPHCAFSIFMDLIRSQRFSDLENITALGPDTFTHLGSHSSALINSNELIGAAALEHGYRV